MNSTDFENAVWTFFDGKVRFPLGPYDGEYEIWLGLKGGAEDSKPTWLGTSVTLDRVAPTVVITSPTASNVSQPMIQIRGHIDERLWSVDYDLSNALGVQTNLAGSPREVEFEPGGDVTSWFQCFDVELTNGAINVTLRVTDLAGNLTQTPLSYTLASDAVPPDIEITWPADGARLTGTSFTLRGRLDDDISTLSAEITGGGQTTPMPGLVERGGTFWVEDLPLATGQNIVTLTATDAWGNQSTDQFTFTKSSFALTIDELADENQLNRRTVTMTGTVGDSNHKVWINGVAAVNHGNGTWTADDVPVTSGGTAVFTATAIPLSDNNGNGTPQTGDPDDPSTQNPMGADDKGTNQEKNKPSGLFFIRGKWIETSYYGLPAGAGSEDWELDTWNWEWNERDNEAEGHYVHDNEETAYIEPCLGGARRGSSYYIDTDWQGMYEGHTDFWVYDPSCGVSTVPYLDLWDFWPEFSVNGPWAEGALSCSFTDHTAVEAEYSFSRSARDVKIEYRPGGKRRPGQKDLFVVNGAATEVVSDVEGMLQVWWRTPFVAGPTVPPQEIFVKGFNKYLGVDGYAYAALPAGEPVDVTLSASRQYYEFAYADASDHRLKILANGGAGVVELADTVSEPAPEFCAGQKTSLALAWETSPPGLADYTDFHWNIEPDYVNKIVPGQGDASDHHTVDPALHLLPVTSVWWLGGTDKRLILCGVTITFDNGQSAELLVRGRLAVYRPSATLEDHPPAVPGVWNDVLELGHVGQEDMEFEITVESKYSGRFDITQLVNRSAVAGTHTDTTEGQYWLDANRFFIIRTFNPEWPMWVDANIPLSQVFHDGPEIVCQYYVGYWTTSVADYFKYYVMFRPDAGIPSDNIYIPLGMGAWSWSAETTYSDGSWSDPTGGPATRPTPPDPDVVAPPEWPHIYNFNP